MLRLEKLEGMAQDNTPVTREELFKTLVTIDREFLKNKGLAGGLGSMGELAATTDALRDVLNQKFSDADFNEMHAEFVAADLEALSGMGKIKAPKFVNKIASKIKNTKVVKKVVAVVAPVIKKAVAVVKKAVQLPTKGALKAIFALFEGKLAAKLAYALIPENSPVLTANPIVAEKRKAQLDLVKKLSEKGGIEQSYFLKHIENGLHKGFNKDINAFIKDASKSEGLEGDGMGITPEMITAIIGGSIALVTLASSIISVHKNKPGKKDFTAPVTDDVQTDVPSKGSFADVFFSPIKAILMLPLMVATASQIDFSNTQNVAIASVLVIGTGIASVISFFKK